VAALRRRRKVVDPEITCNRQNLLISPPTSAESPLFSADCWTISILISLFSRGHSRFYCATKNIFPPNVSNMTQGKDTLPTEIIDLVIFRRSVSENLSLVDITILMFRPGK